MAFCGILDVENVLQIDIATDNTACQAATDWATEAIKNYCKQEIDEITDGEVTFDVPRYHKALFLPELPVTEVSEVVEDDETLVEGADEDYQLANHGKLIRRGNFWKYGVQIVTVTYSHGYDVIPEDIVMVCARAAARAFQAGRRSSENSGVPGISSKQLGDFSVSYSAGSSTGRGVSGARFLLLSEKDILDKYRLREVL